MLNMCDDISIFFIMFARSDCINGDIVITEIIQYTQINRKYGKVEDM